jgi:hypothetical protein
LKTFHFYLRTESSEDISKADKKLSKLYCWIKWKQYFQKASIENFFTQKFYLFS